MRNLIHRLIAWLLGECPVCHSLRVHEVHGWPKLECEKCGYR